VAAVSTETRSANPATRPLALPHGRRTSRTGSDRPTTNVQRQQLQRTELKWYRSKNGTGSWREYKTFTFSFLRSSGTISPGYGFAGRFGAAPGGGVMVCLENGTRILSELIQRAEDSSNRRFNAWRE
jgi:hypothetical protein